MDPGFRRPRRGLPAKGLAYERRFGRWIAEKLPIRSGEWFAFEDVNGPGLAQPDHFAVLPDKILLFECKLTQTPEAWRQIRGLYGPILSFYFGLPVEGVQVCRRVVDCPDPIFRFEEVRDGATWLWI